MNKQHLKIFLESPRGWRVDIAQEKEVALCQEYTKLDLKDFDFRNCTVDLDNADFMYADLTNATFDNCSLKGANFMSAILDSVTFENSQLRRAYFVYANCKNANFKGAELFRANFGGADITGANLEEAETTADYYQLPHELDID